MIVSLACSLPFIGARTGQDKAQEQAAGPTAVKEENQIEDGTLRCELEGYPCTLDEVPSDLLAEGKKIMESSLQQLQEGANMEEIAAEISGKKEVVEVLYDSQMLSFQLEGAPPMWIAHPDQVGDSKGAPGIDFDQQPVLQQDDPEGPVGPQPSQVEPDKQALVLSPYLWDFQVDETDAISAQFKANRNYDCSDCVKLIQKTEKPIWKTIYPTASIQEVIQPFQDWEDYEIIHVSTHGGQVCLEQEAGSSGIRDEGFLDINDDTAGDSGCRTAIFTGSLWTGALFDALIDADGERENDFSTPGVVLVGSGIVPGEGLVGSIALSTDFFRNQYPDKLDDKVIFFSACKSMADTSFYHTLVGENSVYLGWDDNVGLLSATEISEKFYEILIEEGWDARQAYKKTKEFEGYANGLDQAGADLVGAGERALFGREVITLVHPATRVELQDGDTTVTQGVINDGEEDNLYFAALAEGLDEEHALEDYTVHVRVDGVERDFTFTPKASLQKDQYDYYVQGAVKLPFDVTNQETIQLETWMELPGGGETRHVLNEIKPVACGWNGTMSGPVSGEFSGLIMDFNQTLAAVESGELPEILTGGEMGSMGSVSGMGEAASAMGNGWVITFDPEKKMTGGLFPELGLGFIGTLDMDVLGYNTEGLNYQANQLNEKVTTGSFSGSYYGVKLTDGKFQRTAGPQFQGEFTFHEEALCSLDVILPIIENYAESVPHLPGGGTP
jgi:hypothetical protein